jgi:AmmeMemoRadiSam system protein B
MSTSDSPERTARIIIPGADAEPSEPGSAPRIVLPPGVQRPGEAAIEDLPEYPRLRPLILMPIRDGDRELLIVTDPLGVIAGQPVMSLEALALLELLDGTVSIADLTAALMRESKDLRMANVVRDFVAELDRLLMLDSPRFEAAYREVREAWHQLEIRPAVCEGRSYPAAPAELERFLGETFEAAGRLRDTGGEPEAASDARPRALLVPHLDPRRAGPAIARAFLELGAEQREPLRVVVFGTGHSLMDDLYALTRKHFETPLGQVACDTAFVDALAARLGEIAYRGELAHRDEHSIEFQALYLKHRFGGRPLKLVPILCGGFHALLDAGHTPREEPVFEALIAAVRDTAATLGGPTVYLAGVDFSHVGPRFGDPAIDERMRAEIEARDREAIAAAGTGDADAWFASIAAHQDATRICGLAPVYAMLRCADVQEGRLMRYEQSDEPDGSTVTIAAMAWDGPAA